MSERMKKSRWIIIGGIVLVVVIAGGIYLVTRPETAIEINPQVVALEELEASSEIQPEILFKNGFPVGLYAKVPVEGDDPVERAENFLDTYQDLYLQNTPYLDLNVSRVNEENGGSVLFFQTYKGLRIFGGELVVIMSEDMIYGTGGNLLSEAKISLIPEISKQEAQAIALDEAGAESFILGMPELVIFDESLVNYDMERDPHLAWEITAQSTGPYRYMVDAHNGEILFSYPLFATHGGALAGIEVDIETANGTNASSTNCYWWTTADDHIGSENGLISEYINDWDAIVAFWGARETYAFYHTTYGRHSWRHEAEIQIYIHANLANVDNPNGNANWTGESCGAIQFHTGWVAGDIMTHEFTHAVIDVTTGLIYQDQSGALNESYADIMAAVMTGDWTIGEGCCPGLNRSMSNPGKDMYSKYVYEAGDYGGVHSNSGIYNKAAYLLGHGEFFNGWEVHSIGKEKLGVLSYVVMTSQLASNTPLLVAAWTTMSTAASWAETGAYGFTDYDACQVRNAFTAVELWPVGDFDCDGEGDIGASDYDHDHINDTEDNCPEVKNPDQKDYDQDGEGDLCDDDDDNDGFPDSQDNCQFFPNNQADQDHDGKGDMCDDDDNDGVLDVYDNCPDVSNSSQSDRDEDGLGDHCDPDDDNDGVDETVNGAPLDNCFFVPNSEQADADGDGIGDACDLCPNTPDNMQAYTDVLNPPWGTDEVPKPLQPDTDGDGIPDACDDDMMVGQFPLNLTTNKINVDGSMFDGEVRGEPGGTLLVPLPVCPPDKERWYSSEFGALLTVDGLDPGIGLAVINNFGDRVGRASNDGEMRYLPYRQRMEEKQFMQFFFPEDHDPNIGYPFLFAIFCGTEDELHERMPDHEPEPELDTPPKPGESSDDDRGDDATPTYTPTATEEEGEAIACVFTATVNLFCRTGPGSHYPEIDTFTPDTSAPVIGQSADGIYWYVVGPHYGETCTVPSDPNYGSVTGDCDTAPRFTPISVPLGTETSTPDPDEVLPPSRDGEKATPTPVQGCTVFDARTGSTTCESPCPAGAFPGYACTVP